MEKINLIEAFEARGYLKQCTNLEGLKSLSDNEQIIGYIGFDCTAKSLHVGSLVQIMMLRMLQKLGHKPIVVMGGATTKIGDPSGRDETRQLLSAQQILENKESMKKVFARFLSFGDKPTDAIMIDNSIWLEDIKYIDFLREVGPHFTINRMLTFDSVKSRLDRQQPLTLLEFNYMLLQAYDFVELNKRYNCRLQMGGSDQWGNLVNGMELGRRVGCPELFGLTSPLVTTKSGAKMGKTAAGAVWLNPAMLSPYEYWQFWRNTEDGDVETFLKLFTELPLSEIAVLAKLKDKDINEAKIVLANEATKLCHGEEEAQRAYTTALKTFQEGSIGQELPIYYIEEHHLKDGILAFKLLHMSGLCSSATAARKLIQGKGAKLNDKLITDEYRIISIADLIEGKLLKLSVGQKKHILVKINLH